MEASKQEMEEILKIIKKSDYNVVEQLGQNPSKISMLSLLLCSEAYAKALIAFLKTTHVSQETSEDQFKDCVASLTADNGLGFSVMQPVRAVSRTVRQLTYWRRVLERAGCWQPISAIKE